MDKKIKQDLLTELFGFGGNLPQTSTVIPDDLHQYLLQQPKKYMKNTIGGTKVYLRTDNGRDILANKLLKIISVLVQVSKEVINDPEFKTAVLPSVQKLFKKLSTAMKRTHDFFKSHKLVPIYALYNDIFLMFSPKDKKIYTLWLSEFGDMPIILIMSISKHEIKELSGETLSDKNCVIDYKQWLKESQRTNSPYDVLSSQKMNSLKGRIVKNSIKGKVSNKSKGIIQRVTNIFKNLFK